MIGWVMIGALSLSAQDRELTLQYLQKDKIPTEIRSLKASLNYLEEVFDVTLTYKSHLVEDKFIRSEDIYEEDFYRTMDELLRPVNLKYEKIGTRSFVILPNDKPLLKEVQQDTTVRGEVIDASTGETLPGVNVILKGTTEGTATIADGTFELTVESLQDTLIFSFVGYLTREVPINGRTTLDIELQQQAVSGEELVVVGYGTASRATITTSVGSVQSEELVERPTAINLEQGLAGKVAGVNVMTNSGKPGGKPTIKIRGVGSINTSTDPLYVVDGIVGVDPTLIDPSIIASVDILKDAASTAIYGARGANGVVLITTKRNTSGAANTVTYNSSVSWGQLPREVDVLDGQGALDYWEMKYNYPYAADPSRQAPHLPGGQDFPRKDDLFNEDGTPKYNTNWQKEATRTSFSHNHSLTFAGGTDELNVLASVNYRDNEGIILNSYQKIINANINLGWDVKPWLNIDASVHGGADQRNNIDGDPLSSTALRKTYEFLPFLPVRYPDGTWSRMGDYPGAENSENPVRLLEQVDNTVGRTYTRANVITTFKVLDELNIVGIFGGQTVNTYDYYYGGIDLQGVSNDQNGVATRRHDVGGTWNIESYANYVNDFDKHHIDLIGGASWYYVKSSFTLAGSENFFDDYYGYQNLAAGSVSQNPDSEITGNQMNSYYGRANYNYDERYLLGASIRADGSSRFGENNKYGTFSAFSVGWNISNESFYGDNLQDVISNLKLRASWGAVGNAEIGDYVTQPRLSNSAAPFGGTAVSTVYLSQLGNPDLTWESSEQFDVGVDMGLFDNRINIIADYYVKTNRDLLYNNQFGAHTGFSTVTQNIGSIRNRGVELSVNTLNVNSRNFQWNSTVNFTRNISKVIDLNDDFIEPWGKRIEEGRPVDQFFGYDRIGIWSTDEAAEAAQWGSQPGDVRFRDVDGDGVITTNDRVPLGSGAPDFELNLQNTFSYKSFRLMVDVQSMYGLSVQNTGVHLMQRFNSQTNSYTRVLNSWTPDNQDTILPAVRLPSDALSPWQVFDNYNTEDATFIRIRNITFSYRLDTEWLEQLLVKDLTLGASVENAFLWTKYSGADPEYSSLGGQLEQGVDIYQYPKPRTLTFSLKANF